MSRPDETGVAMITAVLATLAVLLLAVVAVGFSLRSSNTSAQNRERVQGIAAADAGVDFYFSHLTTAREDSISCSLAQQLTTEPPGEFTVTAEFFNAGGPVACSGGTLAAPPTSALIRSVGSVGGSGVAGAARTMEALVTLRRLQGTLGFGPFAVFSNGNLSLDSNTQIIGSQGNNADVYTNGNATLDSNTLVSGSVSAAGTLTMDSNSEVKQDVHSAGNLRMASNTIIRGNATSGNGSITMNGNAHIFGDARACTTISPPSARIDGSRNEGSCVGPPTPFTFPTVAYNRASWETAGYAVRGFADCPSAQTFVNDVSTGAQPARDYVVTVSAKCTLSWNAGTLNIRGNLAVFSNGGVSLGGNQRVVPVGGPHDLFFFLGRTPGAPCDFEMLSNARIDAGLPTLVHTPCTVRLRSNSSVASGQFFGENVSFDSNSGFLNFVPLVIPGEPSPGWDVDVQYRREVN